MNSDMQVVQLYQTTYYIDISRQEFRETCNHWNSISFEELVIDGDELLLFYDTSSKCAFSGNSILSRNMVVISLPLAMVISDTHK